MVALSLMWSAILCANAVLFHWLPGIRRPMAAEVPPGQISTPSDLFGNV